MKRNIILTVFFLLVVVTFLLFRGNEMDKLAGVMKNASGDGLASQTLEGNHTSLDSSKLRPVNNKPIEKHVNLLQVEPSLDEGKIEGLAPSSVTVTAEDPLPPEAMMIYSEPMPADAMVISEEPMPADAMVISEEPMPADAMVISEESMPADAMVISNGS